MGERIREAAKECGTVEKMAEMAGIPRRTLYNYLKGPREPKAAQLAAIARVTGVSLDWLITGSGAKFSRPQPIDEKLPDKAQAWVDLITPIGRLITQVHKQHGSRLSNEQLISEITRWHLTLLNRDPKASSWEEMTKLLNWVEERLQEELQEKVSDPLTSKREAS